MSDRIFVAYPSRPVNLEGAIQSACKISTEHGLDVVAWPQLDTAGQFIANSVMEEIDKSALVVADITRLNFNVTFEVGYAMGKRKPILPVLNAGLQPATKEISKLGIFDTLGYQSYENGNSLFSIIKHGNRKLAVDPNAWSVDSSTPLFILDTEHKGDAQLRILSKIKKAKIRYRSFDPKESSRLLTSDAVKHVCQSIAVIVNLLSPQSTDYQWNNLRGAFLMGLAYGLQKELLAFQDGDDQPIPMDYREIVRVYKHPHDVDEDINELAPKIMEALQYHSGASHDHRTGLLESLNIGSPAAENEMITLADYYVPTDEYNKTCEGQARLVVGRKGSGKTALFLQVRDKIRQQRQKKVVLDLKPEGYQLKRFKSAVLDLLSEAVKEHAATAFWEYSLLLEVCYRLLEKDRDRARNNAEFYVRYERLRDLYGRSGRGSGEGDFSERLRDMIDQISNDFGKHSPSGQQVHLTADEITRLIYRQDIAKIREELCGYLGDRDEVWILFDNIDKGWPTRGVEMADIIILRSLLEATRKIEQFFARRDLVVHSVVLLRNDVYELLVDESPDRGKESRVSLDWTDPDRLRELLRRRIASNEGFSGVSFDAGWRRICVSHVMGEDSSQYLIDRSLMRPRNLLTLVNYAKSNAVNLGHSRIEENDIIKAVASYSADNGNEIGLEIRDVFPQAPDVLYNFIFKNQWQTMSDIRSILAGTSVPKADHDRLIEMLVWFSFFGVVVDKCGDIQEIYIYNVHYDMKKLKTLARGFRDDSQCLCVHPAFWPFLEISSK